MTRSRTAIFLAMGPSLHDLENKIESFRDLFAFWVSIKIHSNFLKVNILDKIDEDFAILHGSQCNILDVGTSANILISLLKIGFDKIFVFGLDGGPVGSSLYYKDHNLGGSTEDMLLADVNKTNNHFMEWAKGLNAKEKIFNCSPESLITCFNKISVDEAIIRLQKLGYEDLRGR